MSRRSPHFSRRGLLKGLGAAAAITPLIPIVEAEAMDGVPKRMILMFSACGTIRPNWLPTGGETTFTLPSILAPLEPHRDDIVVVDGLRFNNGGAGNRHMSGPSKFSCGSGLLSGGEFTGGGDASSGWGGGTSIDQVYAAQSSEHTAFASLELGVRVNNANPRTRLSYAGPDQPIPPENDPWAVFDRVFSEFDHDAAELAKLRAQRRSVIDTVRSHTLELQSKVATGDRQKIDAHLDSLREIEKRLDLSVPIGEACEMPMVGEPIDVGNTANYPDITRLHMDLLVMAMACDLTRAASFMWNGSTSSQTFPWLGISEGHHDLSHEGDGNADAQQKLTDINGWYAEQFAYLVGALKAIPEGDGTMLDNTVVVWGNELGKGNSHSHTQIPLVLAGGAGGAITTGRFLSYDDVENNRLLVSILRAVGLTETDSFGDLDTGSGPLPGL